MAGITKVVVNTTQAVVNVQLPSHLNELDSVQPPHHAVVLVPPEGVSERHWLSDPPQRSME